MSKMKKLVILIFVVLLVSCSTSYKEDNKLAVPEDFQKEYSELINNITK